MRYGNKPGFKFWPVLACGGFSLLVGAADTVCAKDAGAKAAPAQSSTLMPITVADTIGMTRLADPHYSDGVPSEGRVAQFSPDGKKFVIVLRKGNLERNVNEFSIYLFRTDEVFSSPKPDLLVTMASSSNRDGVHSLRWLDDNETLAFVGEEPEKTAQVYEFNVRERKLQQRTSHPTAIRAFAITGDGRQLVYVAEARPKRLSEAERQREIVIDGQSLDTLLAGDSSYRTYDWFWTDELFSQREQNRALQIFTQDPVWVGDGEDLHLSPDGRYCIVPTTLQNNGPAWWRDYTPDDESEKMSLKMLYSMKRRSRERSNSTFLTLIDVEKGTSKIFLDTPMAGFSPIAWALDSRSAYIRSYLPLDTADAAERKARSKQKFSSELAVPSGNVLRKLTDEEWRAKTANAPKERNVAITIEEDLNIPPRVYAADSKTGKKNLLMDLNPDFASLQFGKVEPVEWSVTPKLKVKGSLYFPPDYKAGQKYPVVVQTHGFTEKGFSMDGLNEWSTVYAARPLAGKGFLVLQTYVVGDDFPFAHFNDDQRFGVTRIEAGWKFDIEATEAAVDYLNERGLIDPSRVGITGFSREVATLAYMLTHPRHHYAAAIMADGFDAGYLYYLQTGSAQDIWQYDETLGGNAPFGDGLKAWLKESPGFNLDKVATPVRLMVNGRRNVIGQWEWFAGLLVSNSHAGLEQVE